MKFLRQDGWFQPVAGADIVTSTATTTGFLTYLTGTLASSANFVGSFVDGPTIAQGSSGVWYADCTGCFTSGTAGVVIVAKLWDGTNLINAGSGTIPVIGTTVSISASGVLANPAGNLRMSAFAVAGTASGWLAVAGGQANVSSITAIRIG